MAKVKVGIIGSGYWGPNLIRNLRNLPDAEVVAVADLSEERLQGVRDLFPGVATTSNFRDLLVDGVDAIVIATPVSTHFALANEALLHDKHVLVEKPLTHSVTDATVLVGLAESRDLRLMVGHVFEYNPAVEYLRYVVQSGELGEIQYIDAVRAALGLYSEDINVVWDLAPHDFSILRYVLGADPINVVATGADYVCKNVHDVAYITATYPGSIRAHLRVSWLEPRKQRHMTIVGSRKMVFFDDTEPIEKIKVFDMGVDFHPELTTRTDRFKYRIGSMDIPTLPRIEPLFAECRHFVDSIKTGQEPRSNGQSGLEVVRALDMASSSLTTVAVPQSPFALI